MKSLADFLRFEIASLVTPIPPISLLLYSIQEVFFPLETIALHCAVQSPARSKWLLFGVLLLVALVIIVLVILLPILFSVGVLNAHHHQCIKQWKGDALSL